MTSIETILTITSEKIRFVLDRIEQLKLLRFPSKNPEQFINMFELICKTILNKIDFYRSDFYNSTDEEEKDWIKEEVQLVATLVKDSIAPQLRYIEGASVNRNPCSLVHPLEKLTQNILANTLLIVRPQWKYNFGKVEIMQYYRTATLTFFSAEEQNNIFNNMPDYFEILSFPGFEKTNVLLHVNLGHEIGHHLQEEYFKNENDNYLFKIKEEVANKLPIGKSYEKYTKKINKDTNEVDTYRKRFIQEIISDLFCSKLFGPAALFSFFEMAAFGKNFDNIDEEYLYPPWRTRLRIMLEDLQWSIYNKSFKRVATKRYFREDWATKSIEAFENDMKIIEEIVNNKIDEKHIKSNKLARIAFNSVNESLKEIKRFLNKKLRGHLCLASEEFCKWILLLVERLHYDIPPNEFEIKGIKKISDLKTIFNAGWLFKRAFLSSIFELKGQKDYFDRLYILNRLVLKGIELSDINLKFVQYRNTRGTNGNSFN